jgi:hypothetical protein
MKILNKVKPNPTSMVVQGGGSCKKLKKILLLNV